MRAKVDGGEGGIRTRSAPLDSVTCRNHVADIAMVASIAVAHCPPLPAEGPGSATLSGEARAIRNGAIHKQMNAPFGLELTGARSSRRTRVPLRSPGAEVQVAVNRIPASRRARIGQRGRRA